MKKTAENLTKWLTEAKTQLENSPPLNADIESVEEAFVKHRVSAYSQITDNCINQSINQ